MPDIVKQVIPNTFRSQIASSQDIHPNFNLTNQNRDCWFQNYTQAIDASISFKLLEFLKTIKKLNRFVSNLSSLLFLICTKSIIKKVLGE